MNQLNTQEEKKAYEEYVKSVTPVHSLPKNMLKTFTLAYSWAESPNTACFTMKC